SRFDYAKPPLIRATLVRTATNGHYLIFVLHHLVCDLWSLTILRDELESLYGCYAQQLPSTLPDLAFNATDFAMWQREQLTGQLLENLVSYWRQQWNEFEPGFLKLWDFPFTQERAAANGPGFSVTLDPDISQE